MVFKVVQPWMRELIPTDHLSQIGWSLPKRLFYFVICKTISRPTSKEILSKQPHRPMVTQGSSIQMKYRLCFILLLTISLRLQEAQQSLNQGRLPDLEICTESPFTLYIMAIPFFEKFKFPNRGHSNSQQSYQY